MAGRRQLPVDRHGNQAPADVEHDYVVMGDLGVGGLNRMQIRQGIRRYIVRMFIGGIHPGADVRDDEFVEHIEDLHDAVGKRISEIAANPAKVKLARLPMRETEDHLTLTGQHPGHAVGVPGHWLSEDRDQYERQDFPL